MNDRLHLEWNASPIISKFGPGAMRCTFGDAHTHSKWTARNQNPKQTRVWNMERRKESALSCQKCLYPFTIIALLRRHHVYLEGTFRLYSLSFWYGRESQFHQLKTDSTYIMHQKVAASDARAACTCVCARTCCIETWKTIAERRVQLLFSPGALAAAN